MFMIGSPLSKHAGPIAAVTGGLFALAHLGQFLVADRSDLVAMMTDPVFVVFSAAYFIAFPLLLVALVALYWRQAGQAGLFGAVAFCTALTGTVALAGDMWFDAFAVPWLVQVAPPVVGADRSGSLLMAGWLVSVVLFSLGWILFGLASFRTRAFPRAMSVAVAVGGLIGFKAATAPWGVALGLAVAAVGVWLTRQDRSVRGVQTAAAPPPVPAAQPR
jgi:hypothetical protein